MFLQSLSCPSGQASRIGGARPAAPRGAGQGGVLTRLEPASEGCGDLTFTGQPLAPRLARGIAYGYLHPEAPHALFEDMARAAAPAAAARVGLQPSLVAAPHRSLCQEGGARLPCLQRWAHGPLRVGACRAQARG